MAPAPPFATEVQGKEGDSVPSFTFGMRELHPQPQRITKSVKFRRLRTKEVSLAEVHQSPLCSKSAKDPASPSANLRGVFGKTTKVEERWEIISTWHRPTWLKLNLVRPEAQPCQCDERERRRIVIPPSGALDTKMSGYSHGAPRPLHPED